MEGKSTYLSLESPSKHSYLFCWSLPQSHNTQTMNANGQMWPNSGFYQAHGSFFDGLMTENRDSLWARIGLLSNTNPEIRTRTSSESDMCQQQLCLTRRIRDRWWGGGEDESGDLGFYTYICGSNPYLLFLLTLRYSN